MSTMPSTHAPPYPGGSPGVRLAFLAAVLEVVLALGAFYGGGFLLLDPTGRAIGLPLALLVGTPFRSFLLPGLVLFVGNGVLPTLAAVSTVLWPSRAPALALASGAVLTGWMIGEVLLIGYTSWLQLALLGLGLVLFGVGAAWWSISRT